MNDDNELKDLLHSALPPTVATERDLWPQMTTRLESRPRTIPWFEWALVSAALLLLIVSPMAFPILLYWL